jgi:uncharacterized protein (TIGR03086 family)
VASKGPADAGRGATDSPDGAAYHLVTGVVGYGRALDMFGALVRAVRPGDWSAPTPCEDWDVRRLVNHVTVEQLWAPLLLRGATIAEVGDRFVGDQLDDSPLGAWERAREPARAAFTATGAWDRPVMLSSGPASSAEYGFEMTTDLFIHSWDLAKAIGVEPPSDPDLAHVTLHRLAPQAERWRAVEVFGPAEPVNDDADDMTRLLALAGRRADWNPPQQS